MNYALPSDQIGSVCPLKTSYVFVSIKQTAKGNTHKVLNKFLDSTVIEGQHKSLLVGITSSYFKIFTLVGDHQNSTNH